MFYVTCGLKVYYSKNLIFTSFRNNQGDWSTEGCFVNETTTNYTTCYCYHLTNFAVLMSLTETGTALIIVRKYSNMCNKPHENVMKNRVEVTKYTFWYTVGCLDQRFY